MEEPNVCMNNTSNTEFEFSLETNVHSQLEEKPRPIEYY